MGRRQDRQRGVPAPARPPAPVDEPADWGGVDYLVRRITGSSSVRTYRCPGCDQQIRPATPHVVAWPAGDPGAGLRRHWHTACWRARDRRTVRVQHSRSAPRHG